jgi:hypothetical protein
VNNESDFRYILLAPNLATNIISHSLLPSSLILLLLEKKAGHMVPQFRPQAALHFLKMFIDGEGESRLSPLMPYNASLAEMSDKEFKDALNAWTKAATKPPYVDHDVVSMKKRGEEQILWSETA